MQNTSTSSSEVTGGREPAEGASTSMSPDRLSQCSNTSGKSPYIFLYKFNFRNIIGPMSYCLMYSNFQSI